MQRVRGSCSRQNTKARTYRRQCRSSHPLAELLLSRFTRKIYWHQTSLPERSKVCLRRSISLWDTAKQIPLPCCAGFYRVRMSWSKTCKIRASSDTLKLCRKIVLQRPHQQSLVALYRGRPGRSRREHSRPDHRRAKANVSGRRWQSRPRPDARYLSAALLSAQLFHISRPEFAAYRRIIS